MVLKFWWLALALFVIAALAVWVLSRPGTSQRGGVPVAHTYRLTRLPAFVRRRTRLLWGAGAVFSILVLTAVSTLFGIARPVWIQTINPERHLRDVMLCLDASGSMVSYDAAIIQSYLDMLDSFDGERIGMTVFNTTAVSVFPLTDDYAMVREFLEEAKTGFETGGVDGTDFFAGTVDPEIGGSSLIGDGLTSCVDNFDKKGEKRSRSIILATDNQLAGVPIFSLQEATEIAQQEEVRVYTVAPRSPFFGSEIDELQETARVTGGRHYALGSSSATDGIVNGIQEQEAQKTESKSVTLVHDKPVLPLTLTLLGTIAGLALMWRFKL
jgi:Ca-activated chloride channel homolog